MIKGNVYVEIVEEYFAYLLTEFNCKLLEEKIRANVFYDVQYGDGEKIVSISYENIEDYVLVTIFLLLNGEMPDYDDKTKLLNLSKLNSVVLSKVSKSEMDLNNIHFVNFHPESEIQKKLLKAAKELRLCLKHFNDLIIRI